MGHSLPTGFTRWHAKLCQAAMELAGATGKAAYRVVRDGGDATVHQVGAQVYRVFLGQRAFIPGPMSRPLVRVLVPLRQPDGGRHRAGRHTAASRQLGSTYVPRHAAVAA